MSEQEQKRKRGRPSKDNSLTPTERSKKRDDELLASGGKIIIRLRLGGADVAKALERLTQDGEDIRCIVTTALIELAIKRGLSR